MGTTEKTPGEIALENLSTGLAVALGEGLHNLPCLFMKMQNRPVGRPARSEPGQLD